MNPTANAVYIVSDMSNQPVKNPRCHLCRDNKPHSNEECVDAVEQHYEDAHDYRQQERHENDYPDDPIDIE